MFRSLLVRPVKAKDPEKAFLMYFSTVQRQGALILTQIFQGGWDQELRPPLTKILSHFKWPIL